MYEALLKELPFVKFERNKSLGKMTTFATGGNAPLVLYPDKKESFKAVLSALKGRYPYIVLGAGSNLLVSDRGFDGVVVSTRLMNGIRLWGSVMICECGARLKDAVALARDNCLGGLEFAVGIPGTVGGFVSMNGGCFNKCAADRIAYVVGENGVYNADACLFEYRKSRFSNGEGIIEAAFKLKVSEQDAIEAKLQRFTRVRKKSQPKGRSFGCCFLNDGYFAGKLVDKAGLKGLRIGGAYVSREHANFIISDGESSADAYALIALVKKRVYEASGVELKEEIKYVGEFDEPSYPD